MFNMQKNSENKSANVVIDYDSKIVYEATIKAIDSSNKFTLKESNKMMKRVSVSVKMSAFSWGERMIIQLNDINGKTEIDIKSESKASVGRQVEKKNQKNIEEILNLISDYLN